MIPPGTILLRKRGLKRAWGELGERAAQGEMLGYVDAVALAYANRYIDREQARHLLALRVTKAQLADYRRIRGSDAAGLTLKSRKGE